MSAKENVYQNAGWKKRKAGRTYFGSDWNSTNARIALVNEPARSDPCFNQAGFWRAFSITVVRLASNKKRRVLLLRDCWQYDRDTIAGVSCRWLHEVDEDTGWMCEQ